MRTRTAIVVVVGLLALSSVAVYGLTNGSSGSLSMEWVSNTSRPNQVNHHPIVTERINGTVNIIAPISSVSENDGRCVVTSFTTNGSIRWQYAIDKSACAIHGIGDPLIADATNDGQADVLVPTTENRSYVLDATNGSVMWAQNLTNFGYAAPVVLHDPQTTVIQPDFSGMVFANAANGTLRWTYDLNETVVADAHVISVPGEPTPGVAIGSTNNVTVLRPNGSVVWQRKARATWLTKGTIDGHGVLAASGGYNITMFAANGTRLWHRTGWRRPATEEIADGDGDGTLELYVGSNGNSIAALNARTGATEWNTTLSTDANILPAPVTGDVDGDSHPEVVAVTNAGTVHVLDPKTGEVLASYEREVAVWVHPTLADIDGDRADEILVMYGDGRVVALSYQN